MQLWSINGIVNSCVDVSIDGNVVVRNGNSCIVLLMDLYVAVQLLQIHYKTSFPRIDTIERLVPVGLRELFWQGECTEEDIGDIEVEVFSRPNEAESGVFLSLNMFGSTLSFMDAYNELLTEENLPLDGRFHVCVIKMPDGFMSFHETFQFEENWGCQSFLGKLHHTMLKACPDRLPGENYIWKGSPVQIRVRGGNTYARSYVLYTTMSDIHLDKTEMTFDVTWNVMCTYF